MVENRLDLIHTITRKYGGSVDDVLLYFEKITDEYNLLTGNNLSSEDMEVELKKLEKNLVDLAGQVAQARHHLAQDLEAEIKQELLHGKSPISSTIHQWEIQSRRK